MKSASSATDFRVEKSIKLLGKNKGVVDAKAKFDTGTSDNWMSPSVAESLGYELEEALPLALSTFNGEGVDSDRIVRDITWVAADPDTRSPKSHQSDFRIAPRNAPFQVLFGEDFLKLKGVYTFNDSALILAKKTDTEGWSSLSLYAGSTQIPKADIDVVDH